MNSPTEKEIDLADTGLDLAGIGKAMKAVPPEAWQRIVETACSTFDKVLSPITETSYGIGRLIQAKFDRLIEAEKVMAMESISAAKMKAVQTGRPANTPRPQILMQAVENASSEVDGGVRELWSNLLAQEMLTQHVHPEIGRVLSRLSLEDAQLLVKISEYKPTKATRLYSEAIKLALSVAPFDIPLTLNSDSNTFNHAHLQNLGLIKLCDGKWELTIFGEGFIEAVTDPSIAEDSLS